jgi:hypothetical protein
MMPRFFFHLRRDGSRVDDTDGMELGDLVSAKVEARRSAVEIVRESEKQGERFEGKIEVADKSGKVVATALLVWPPLR